MATADARPAPRRPHWRAPAGRRRGSPHRSRSTAPPTANSQSVTAGISQSQSRPACSSPHEAAARQRGVERCGRGPRLARRAPRGSPPARPRAARPDHAELPEDLDVERMGVGAPRPRSGRRFAHTARRCRPPAVELVLGSKPSSATSHWSMRPLLAGSVSRLRKSRADRRCVAVTKRSYCSADARRARRARARARWPHDRDRRGAAEHAAAAARKRRVASRRSSRAAAARRPAARDRTRATTIATSCPWATAAAVVGFVVASRSAS